MTFFIKPKVYLPTHPISVGHTLVKYIYRVRFMVYNTTFNNILIISWRSILLLEETGVPRVNHRPVASH